MDDLYATIYAKTELGEVELAKVIALAFGVSADSWGNVETCQFELSVRKNPDRDGPFFGQYQFVIEFEPRHDVPVATVVKSLTFLLHVLWEHKMQTETSCDYENELPHNGRFDGSSCTPVVYTNDKGKENTTRP